MRWRIGLDTGGTFTDVVGWDRESGLLIVQKVWTESDPADTIIRAIEAIGCRLSDILSITYGTTLVTNALIQGRLARTIFVTTAGFRDLLAIARQNRRTLYSMADLPREPPPVSSEDCREVRGRIDANGNEIEPMDVRAVQALVSRLKGLDVCVAVSLLHSYANPSHERAVAAAFAEVTRHISISSSISGESREYERSLVTVLNAALLPLLARFQSSVRKHIPPGIPIDLFHSAGGMMGLEAASRRPIALAMSGPAAGVEAASHVALEMDLPHAVSFDMGGTTTDVCLLSQGKPAIASQVEVGRWPVRQPMVAVQSIGAGGGSIVSFIDGHLNVGPQSAGATPGPACYNRGGALPTLTDASAIVGYLEGAARFSRQLTIDVAKARAALAPIAKTIGCSVEVAALGVIKVAGAAAARALRRITVERGVDLRDCVLIAYGGAGPMLAAALAASVGINQVIIPRCSSALSALGCLLSARSYTVQRTARIKYHPSATSELDAVCQAVAREAETEFGGAAQEDRPESTFTALMRFSGQSHPIEVPFARSVTLEELTREFHRRHLDLYGFVLEDAWEIDGIRVRCEVPSRARLPAPTETTSTARPIASALCWFADTGPIETALFDRSTLSAGCRLSAPALIVDELSTIVVPPNCAVAQTPHGHLKIRVGDQT